MMNRAKKKDILFMCQYFYPEYISSAVLPFETSEVLANAGFSVGVLCGYPKEYSLSTKVPSNELYKGIEIKRLKYIQLKRNNFIGRLINYFSFTFVVTLNFLYLRKYRSIIVYSNPPILPLIAALANKFFNTKLVFVCYDVYPELALVTNSISKDSIINKIMNIVNRVVFNRVDKVVALSNEMKAFLLKHRSNLSEQKIEVIPNWYSGKEYFKSSEVNSRHETINSIKNKKDGTFVVSYFGNMGICQDLDTIIEAIKVLRNDNKIKFIFAGHGNKMSLLKEIVVREKLDNVMIFGFLHGQDYQDALNISDCFIVSLAKGVTGLAVPSKTYSYMMAGKPIIAIMDETADISKDLKENNAGYVLETGEVSKLVRAIKELRDNPDKCIYMGENCKNIFLKKYTKEKCTTQYVKMMKNILEGEQNV